MTTPNFKNRTIWTGDNLPIMRGLNSESVARIFNLMFDIPTFQRP